MARQQELFVVKGHTDEVYSAVNLVAISGDEKSSSQVPVITLCVDGTLKVGSNKVSP